MTNKKLTINEVFMGTKPMQKNQLNVIRLPTQRRLWMLEKAREVEEARKIFREALELRVRELR